MFFLKYFFSNIWINFFKYESKPDLIFILNDKRITDDTNHSGISSSVSISPDFQYFTLESFRVPFSWKLDVSYLIWRNSQIPLCEGFYIVGFHFYANSCEFRISNTCLVNKVFYRVKCKIFVHGEIMNAKNSFYVPCWTEQKLLTIEKNIHLFNSNNFVNYLLPAFEGYGKVMLL